MRKGLIGVITLAVIFTVCLILYYNINTNMTMDIHRLNSKNITGVQLNNLYNQYNSYYDYKFKFKDSHNSEADFNNIQNYFRLTKDELDRGVFSLHIKKDTIDVEYRLKPEDRIRYNCNLKTLDRYDSIFNLNTYYSGVLTYDNESGVYLIELPNNNYTDYSRDTLDIEKLYDIYEVRDRQTNKLVGHYAIESIK